MTCTDLCTDLLPPQAPLHIEAMAMTERGMTLDVVVTTSQAHCPTCTQPSTHIHSDYHAPGHEHPQTHGGPMQHPHEVDIVLAVLDTREIVVYGRDLLRPIVADGKDVQTAVARIPIGRPESADVLKAYFAACGSVTWAKVLDAGRQIPRLERAMAADPRRNQA
jgi:hypothetical protein